MTEDFCVFSRTVRNPNFIFSLIREDSGAGVIDIQLIRSEDIFKIVRRDFLITEVWAYLHSFFRDGKDAAAFADCLLVMGMVSQDPACCLQQLLCHGVWIPAADNSLFSQAETGRMLRLFKVEHLSLQVYCLAWSRFCILPVFSLNGCYCTWISHWWVLSCWDWAF